MDNHYYTSYNGMSVPSGHTIDYICNVLEDTLHEKIYVSEDNVDGWQHEHVINMGYCEDEKKFKFRRVFNNKIIYLSLYKIYLVDRR